MSSAEAALWLGVAAIVAFAFVIDLPMPFLNDGYVYYAMVASLVEHGSLAYPNGYEEYGSESLYTFHFIPVDGRLMPQYPSGWAFLAAPFYALGGIHGLILLNVLATLLTVWLIRVAGRVLFDDDHVGLVAALLYIFATFAYDYAGAVWPHAPTVACILGAMVTAGLAWRRDDLRWAFAAGLILGFGVNLRADAILPIIALAPWLLGVMRRPYLALALLLVGLVPGFAVAAALNYAKFGIFNPLSYGRGGGATSLGHYADLFPLLAAMAFGALMLGHRSVRRALDHRAVAIAIAAVGVAVLLIVPQFRDLLGRLLAGAAGLVVSLNFFSDRLGTGMHAMEDGTVWFLGWPKKALLQSLPYAAVVICLLPLLFRGRERAGVWLCVLSTLSILLPFAFVGWVGGGANHMRYLLHLLPALVLLSALALRQIGNVPRLVLGVAVGCWVAVLGFVVSIVAGAHILYALQNAMAGTVAAAIALLSVAVLALRGRWQARARTAVRGTTMVGVVIAGVSAWGADFVVHAGGAIEHYPLTQKLRELPKNALVVALNPKWTFERTAEPQTLIATQRRGLPYDPELVAQAFADQKAVFVQGRGLSEKIVEDGAAASADLVLPAATAPHRLYRLLPDQAPATRQDVPSPESPPAALPSGS